MSNDFEKLETKIDKLDDRLDSIDKTLIKQADSLELHIYRTELAEKRLEKIEEVQKQHVSYVNGARGMVKLVGAICFTLSLLATLLKVLR